MSNTSDIYDGLVSFIEGLLPAYYRLPDAYEPTSNDILKLAKGFSVGFGPGENTERLISDCSFSTSRNFIVVFSNLYASVESNAIKRGSLEKALLEDAFSVWYALQKITVLNGVEVTNVKYSDDSGIEYLGDKTRHIAIVSNISLEYFTE
jgi:hypothetical protein